eukprot:COSAG06_NODE_43_length_29826_cov_32.009621_26_plen_161_part_00
MLAHLPLPVSEYTDSPHAVAKPQSQSPHAVSMPMHWYQDLAVKTRRGRKFMDHILSLRELSESMLTEEVGNYIQFLGDVSTADLEEDVEMRVPGLLVDLVSTMTCVHCTHTHTHTHDPCALVLTTPNGGVGVAHASVLPTALRGRLRADRRSSLRPRPRP